MLAIRMPSMTLTLRWMATRPICSSMMRKASSNGTPLSCMLTRPPTPGAAMMFLLNFRSDVDAALDGDQTHLLEHDAEGLVERHALELHADPPADAGGGDDVLVELPIGR